MSGFMDPVYLGLAFFFGMIGMGYFMFGKKQGNPGALVAGIILMCYSYIVTEPIPMILIGIGAMGLPFLIAYFLDSGN